MSPSPGSFTARRPRGRLTVSGRETNLALLAALVLAYATGVLSETVGSARGWWVAAAHGVVGIVVVLLVPWKKRVAQRALRRRGATRWISLLMAPLVAVALLTGVGSATGLVRSIGDRQALWFHVAVALVLAPLVVWHALARRARPRRGDLSRRTVLRAGALGVAALGAYVASSLTAAAAGLPGRRFTGSHEQGSFEPDAMPATIWLDDSPPVLIEQAYRLTVVCAAQTRSLTLADLSTGQVTRRGTLDCTSGWYAHQDWTGVPLRDLLGDVGDARSILVRSATGYWVRLPVEDVDSLLLATAVGGRPLSLGHGAPARLVAPGRRGFWWVKWVDRIELQDTPAWWQPPFPVT